MRQRSFLLRGGVAAILVMGLAGCAAGRPVPVADAPALGTGAAGTALQQALEHLPDGQALEWRDAAGQANGVIVVQRTFRDASGAYCRSFSQTLAGVGGSRTVVQTACRSAGGRWQVDQV